jgi:hypothetical protein
MGNIQIVNQSSTLYSKALDSTPAQFAKDNPVMATAGTLGAGVIVKQVVDHSELAAKVLEKGVVPVLGLSAAVFGASMVKDAFQQDLPKTGSVAGKTPQEQEEISDANVKLVAKTLGGTALAITGVEVAGQSAFGISPIGKTFEKITDVIPAETFFFGGLAAGGAYAAVKGAESMKENGVTLGNAAAVGFGSTAAVSMAGQAAWMPTQFTKYSHSVIAVGDKATGIVGGAALGLGAYALTKGTLEALDQGKTGMATLMGAGAASAAVASVHILGNSTGVPALANLGNKLFTKNPLLAGSIAAVGLTAGAYYLYSQKQAASEASK